MVPQANMVAIGTDGGCEKKDPVSLDVELSLPPFPRRKPACTTITVERVRSRHENVSRLLYNTLQILVAVAIPILVIIFIAFQIPPGTMMGLVQHPVTNNVEVVIPSSPPQEKEERKLPNDFPQISPIDLSYSSYSPRKYDDQEMKKLEDEVMTALFAQMPSILLDAFDDFLTATGTPTGDSILSNVQQSGDGMTDEDLIKKLLLGNTGKSSGTPEEKKPLFANNYPSLGSPYPVQFGGQMDPITTEPLPPVLNPAAALDNADWPVWKFAGDDEYDPSAQAPEVIPAPAMFDGIDEDDEKDNDQDEGLWSDME